MSQRSASVGTLCAFALLSGAFTFLALAQSTEWKEYASEKGKFSVLLPGAPETGYRFGPSDSGAVISYVINYQKGAKAWSVDYFDLPAIPPNADAVKKLLERRRDSYTNKPGSEKSETRSGYPMLEFREPNDDRDRVRIIRIMLVKQRVYELWALTQANQAASEEVTRFFDSFTPIPLTDEEVVEAAKSAIADKAKAAPLKLTVSGGVLVGSAIKKVQPPYPIEAKSAGVSGEVKIRVLISEEGNVIEAEAVEGPDLLRDAALTAARAWVFKPIALAGRPVKITGILTFKFLAR